MDCKKYKRGYFMPKQVTNDWASKEYIDKVPTWCSVDLRDGNQALITPMSLEDKLKFFSMLVQIGFKEIEVGFPAASETEFEFVRAIIERKLIPEDVTIQVLTQAREHIIEKTFQSLEGVKKAIVHVYNSTSFAQRQQVFKKSKEEIIKLAVEGAKIVQEKAKEIDSDIRFEYSPESFTGTEPEFALDIINAVLNVWKPTNDKKAVINLPVTVEMSLPHVYACQVEYIVKNINYRNGVEISLHPHNDRGTAVADSELGLLAGADRIEGTLFGNGERTGNVDIITLAMNMYSHGIDPKLNFKNMSEICNVYESVTGLAVSPRQPYAGELVFAAFSGSHQDAIAKGMAFRESSVEKFWTVPYLPIDPMDVGREYSADVIRINSQSGKGGVSYVLGHSFGYEIPVTMREEIGYMVKNASDITHKELANEDVFNIFDENYINREDRLKLQDFHFTKSRKGYDVEMTVENDGVVCALRGNGNGILDSVSNAIKVGINAKYHLTDYKEHSKNSGSNSHAISYVRIESKGRVYWGVGEHEDISTSSIKALISAINRLFTEEK